MVLKAETPPDHMRLLTLPQELQDIIFDYAYPRLSGCKLISRKQWCEVERDERRKDPNHGMRPFPRLKANDFLVSKQYFVAALKAFVQNQDFDDDIQLLFAGGALEEIRTLLSYATSVTIWGCTPGLLNLLPRVKQLTVGIREEEFEVLESRSPPTFAWHDTLGDEDFKELGIYSCLIQCHGLRKFTAVPGCCPWAKSEQEADVWRRNVQAFEILVNKGINIPRERASQPKLVGERNGPTPLYDRSRVCFATSTLPAPGPESKRFHLSSRVPDILAGSSLPRSAVTAMMEVDKTAESAPTSTPQQIRTPPELADHKIPESPDEFKGLMLTNAEAVMEWVRYAKDMTCGIPLKGAVYSTERERSKGTIALGTQGLQRSLPHTAEHEPDVLPNATEFRDSKLRELVSERKARGEGRSSKLGAAMKPAKLRARVHSPAHIAVKRDDETIAGNIDWYEELPLLVPCLIFLFALWWAVSA